MVLTLIGNTFLKVLWAGIQFFSGGAQVLGAVGKDFFFYFC
ncbi:hypothetical protein STRCR_2281 [Streptococcus criceti HS-6]|uniref:Uncharacterized protein n=1 Tax=Streptococcus criceti HS-6 TaxID=873449 RepID=G5JT10_STRCG|nr:hypothetical protein [Streptococcus criceti]EHI75491.1 hypothetical protein STRCR_2281 [Streptococcus criceti HS-6]